MQFDEVGLPGISILKIKQVLKDALEFTIQNKGVQKQPHPAFHFYKTSQTESIGQVWWTYIGHVFILNSAANISNNNKVDNWNLIETLLKVI